MLMTKTQAFENALQTGLLAIDAIELTPLKPMIEHVRLHLDAIEKQAGVTKTRKLIWKTVEIYKALNACSRALTIPGVNVALRAAELMLAQINQHPGYGGRERAIETFEHWQKYFNYERHVK